MNGAVQDIQYLRDIGGGPSAADYFTVGLTELGDVYGITINPTWRTRNIYTVIKSCDKFVVLEDQNKTTQLRIPLWSIREVTVQATGVRSAP